MAAEVSQRESDRSSLARQAGHAAACLDREMLRPEVCDPRYPTDKIRSVVRQESSRIRRGIAQRFVDLPQGLFES